MRSKVSYTLIFVALEARVLASLSWAFTLRGCVPSRPLPKSVSFHPRRSQRHCAAAAAAAGDADPEEAMKKAIAKLLILTAEDARLVDDDDDAPSFLDRPTTKWDTSYNVDEDEDTSEEIVEAITDYEETHRILEESIGKSSEEKEKDEAAPIWAAYRDSSDDGVGIAHTKRDDEREDEDDDDAKVLIPDPNPNANPDAVSMAGVQYKTVLSGLMTLFPPKDLSLRNAASRKDGYWEYVSKGEEPPKHLTYGEFDFYFFAELLDRARYYYKDGELSEDTLQNGWEGMTFTDIGSGTGRLVFAAAALHPNFKLCRGVEILPTIQQVAIQNLDKCRTTAADGDYSSGDGDINNRRPKAFQLSKQSDEDWLQNFSGQLFGGDNEAGASDAIDEGESDDDDDEEEWFSPDGWAATYSAQAGDDEDRDEDEDDDDEWKNPDAFMQQYDVTEDDTGTKKTVDDSAIDAALEEADEYFLTCPSMYDDGIGTSEPHLLPLAPVEFSCGSFEDPYEYFGDSDIVFIFSSCMSQDMMQSLGQAIGRQCKPGSVIITTEFPLPLEGFIGPHQCALEPLIQDDELPSGPYKLELTEEVNGWCWLTGGESTAYIHRVVESLWEEGSEAGKRERPKLSVVQEARAVVEAIRCGDIADTDSFIREVHSNMVFHGLPDEWREVDENQSISNREDICV